MATYMLVRHKVRDFAAWKPAYDAHRPKRDEAGLTEEHVLRGASDANEVVLLFGSRIWPVRRHWRNRAICATP
jgi:hypothetical protein